MTIGAKPAMQERSRKAVSSLLQAMDDLLRAKSFVDITVAELAGKAGVSAASIYQRFSNRDALISILIELYMRRVEAWHKGGGEGAAKAPASLEEAFHLLGGQSWALAEDLGYIIRPAYLQSRLRPDLLGENWTRLETVARDGFRQMLTAFADELNGCDPSRAADALAGFCNMMLVGKLLHWDGVAGGTYPANAQQYGQMIADFALGFIAQQKHGGDTQ